MRSKLLDQYNYADDLTAATDRTGYDTAVVIAIGGTTSTAIKLQHCDTSNGSYTDFAEIVAAADAGETTNVAKGVDISGAKKYLKVTGATTALAVLSDGRVDPNA